MNIIKNLLIIIKAYYIFFVSGWHTLYFIPPNKKLQVMDSNGNLGFAYPTYYPFELKKFEGDNKKQYGWRATPVFYGNGIEKWDGGWMILSNTLNNEIGVIVKWRNC